MKPEDPKKHPKASKPTRAPNTTFAKEVVALKKLHASTQKDQPKSLDVNVTVVVGVRDTKRSKTIFLEQPLK